MILDARNMDPMTRTFGVNVLHQHAVAYIVDVPGDISRCTVVAIGGPVCKENDDDIVPRVSKGTHTNGGDASLFMYIVTDNGSERVSSRITFEDIRPCVSPASRPNAHTHDEIRRADTKPYREVLQKNIHRIPWLRTQSTVYDSDTDSSTADVDDECMIIRTTCLGHGRIFSVCEAIHDNPTSLYVCTATFMHSVANPMVWTTLGFDTGRASANQIRALLFSPIPGFTIPFQLATHSILAAMTKYDKECGACIPDFVRICAVFRSGILAILEYIDFEIFEIGYSDAQQHAGGMSAAEKLYRLFLCNKSNYAGCEIQDTPHDRGQQHTINQSSDTDTHSESSTTSKIIRCPRAHRIYTFLFDIAMSPYADTCTADAVIALATLSRRDPEHAIRIHPRRISLAKLAISVAIYQPCGKSETISSVLVHIEYPGVKPLSVAVKFQGDKLYLCEASASAAQASNDDQCLRVTSKKRVLCKLHHHASIAMGNIALYKDRDATSLIDVQHSPIHITTIDPIGMSAEHGPEIRQKRVTVDLPVNAYCTRYTTNDDQSYTIIPNTAPANNAPGHVYRPEPHAIAVSDSEIEYIRECKTPWAVYTTISPIYGHTHIPVPLALITTNE